MALPGDALVIRGGIVSGPQLMNGCGPHVRLPGVYGFSVQCHPGRLIADLALTGGIPNRRISVTLVGRVRALGWDVVETEGRGLHATVIVDPNWTIEDASRLAEQFWVESNPARRS